MKGDKRTKLEKAGWRVGSTDEFLGLSEDESRHVDDTITAVKAFQVEKKLTADGSSLAELRVPDGWTLEPMERQPDHALLTTPSPRRYMATIDFRARGFKPGCGTSGRFVGDEWNKRRKKYGGRGWRQTLVDDAVAHLQEVLR